MTLFAFIITFVKYHLKLLSALAAQLVIGCSASLAGKFSFQMPLFLIIHSKMKFYVIGIKKINFNDEY